jgi:hypothetical protein
MNQSPRKHQPYAGRATCLRCDRAFQSWERRHNRLCPHCREALERELSGEPPQPLLSSMRGSEHMPDV